MGTLNEKILIVDDSEDMVMMLERKLSEFTVSTAKSGEEMWRVLETEDPSLILLDVVMPDEDGFEIAKKLSSMERFSHIPVVFISAKSEGKDVENGFNSGGFDYIKKPFDLVEVKARIKSAMRKKQLEEDLKALTFTDPLTGIYNRRFFLETLFKTLEHWRRSDGKFFSIAMIDLDFFKSINDTHGHTAGDHVLVEFAKVMKNSIRPYDCLARYGGEEFIILFMECSRKRASDIITRVKNNKDAFTFEYENKQIPVSFSCGISDLYDIKGSSEAEGVTMEELISIADMRLYSAKQYGRNKVVIE